MRKFIFAALLLLSSFSFLLSPLSAENVVRLESATGTASEYGVSELLRVELMGDSIRFIAADGTVAAEVYKYDYVQLTIADKPTAIPVTNDQLPKTTAVKVIRDGQVYILFEDKAYLIDGTKVR